MCTTSNLLRLRAFLPIVRVLSLRHAGARPRQQPDAAKAITSAVVDIWKEAATGISVRCHECVCVCVVDSCAGLCAVHACALCMRVHACCLSCKARTGRKSKQSRARNDAELRFGRNTKRRTSKWPGASEVVSAETTVWGLAR